ncbi:RraA family protein [Paracoccus sediminis]|uniref:Putative 4-hydroxy-4-methyl-2-oxoglutarate aldolase n=1 Tax=Paracoccus sediminis TaxID=1214787 RepID=A0A238YDA5_9RHOB|nr:RraA family protein [Paracoccus sediminis]TBN46785.1 RraA family protein [Paracoccus sediminis]SNR69236.1 RraA famliy [Paracoccus sediminis]
MAIGFRILPRDRAVPADLVARFAKLPVANVSDSMNRMTAAGPRLTRMHRDGVLAGPALTVKARPGDNLMLHKAIDMAAPGDVIVVDAGGDLTNSLMGELMLAYAIKRGVAGFVLNGAIRDADQFIAMNLPVFAAGVTHRGPYKDGPGEINVPIALDGMVIHPGDLMLGDSDGVLAVPFDAAEEVYARTMAKQDAETRQMAAIEAGTNDRSWVDTALKRLGCAMPDGI